MPLKIGVLRETVPGENRVALVPEIATRFAGQGVELVIEKGAADQAGLEMSDYDDVSSIRDRKEILGESDILLTVQPPEAGDIKRMKAGSLVIGFLDPFNRRDVLDALCKHKITGFAMELVPRISRAQSMDALSSQAAAAGYKAALIAANTSTKFFPMLTTAAGTIRPSRVLVIGAGVAGLQAIATAKRLGAIVEGYDVRSATREQVESLGGRFVDTGVSAEGEGGYARELTDEEKARQTKILNQHIALADAVISTAAVPGKKAPRIIDRATVEQMAPGSVIVDIAADTGGNCELTVAGETVNHNGVLVVGPKNLPAQLPRHASEMYSRNLFNFISPAIEDGALQIDWEDEVFAGTVLTYQGEVRHAAVKESLSG